MKKDAEAFQDRDAQLVYVARKLSDALELEKVLTDAGIDYGVEADEYKAGILFRTNRTGAFFYVLPEIKEQAVDVMLSHGFVPAQ